MVLLKDWIRKEQIAFTVSVTISAIMHAWVTIYMVSTFGIQADFWLASLAIACVMPIIGMMLHHGFSATKEEREKAEAEAFLNY
jgi:hypothetical protein